LADPAQLADQQSQIHIWMWGQPADFCL